MAAALDHLTDSLRKLAGLIGTSNPLRFSQGEQYASDVSKIALETSKASDVGEFFFFLLSFFLGC